MTMETSVDAAPPPSTDMGARVRMECCQVALSTSDIARSHWWYRNALGFLAAGDRRHREGAHWATVPGLPEASFDVWCLVGAQPLCQIEMFEFVRPRPRPLPAGRRPCDLGYTMFGICVSDFDAALARIERFGGAPLTSPLGDAGSRRVCLHDPDGVLLELMEDRLSKQNGPGPLAGSSAPMLASVTVSVRSLSRVRRFWQDILGLEESTDTALHGPEHETLWGLDGARRDSCVLRAGDMALELAQYLEPRGRPRPAGYLISDHGVLNVALGTTHRQIFEETYERAASAGFRGMSDPWHLPEVATVVYLMDPEGTSVELLHVEPGALARMGFRANGPTEPSASAWSANALAP